MRLVRLLAWMLLAAVGSRAQDSLTVTFSFFPDPAAHGSFVRAYLPGSFNNWGNTVGSRIAVNDPSIMTYLPGTGEYRHIRRLAVGATYTYKIHLHQNATGSAYVWLSDPLNERVTGPNNDSVLELEPLTIFQPVRLLNEEGRIDTVRAWILAVDSVTGVTFSINGESFDGAGFYDPATGLFQAGLTESREAGSQFRLEVTDTEGRTARAEIGVVIPEVEDAPVPQGLRDGVTYHAADPGRVTLVLRAPGKRFVHVIGDWTGWAADSRYVMKRDTTAEGGTRFWLDLEGLTPGLESGYQYLVDGQVRIADPYTEKVLTPDDVFLSEETYPGLQPYPEGQTQHAVSLLQPGRTPYPWLTTEFRRPAQETLVIYELLVRDFLSRHDFATLVDTLNYLERLGVNAVELMPVQEFEGNLSWGYIPAFYFAPDKYYGPAERLKAFIDACHERGIAVLLDLVLNHSGGQSPFVRLYNTGSYGPPTAENPWHNRVAPHPFSVAYDVNHESPLTQALVDRITSFWLSEYRVDGFRFDLSKGFTQKQTGSDVGRWTAYDPGRIALLKRMADAIWAVDSTAYVILEHFGEQSEEQELARHGLDKGYPGMLLWHNMNRAYSQAAMGYLSDTGFSSDLSGVYYRNRGFERPSQVSYMESHDEQWIMYRLLAYGPRQEEYNVRTLPVALDRMKLAGAFFFLVPGPKMIWQFGELGYGFGPNGRDCLRPDQSLGECPSGTPGRTEEKPVRWEYRSDPLRWKLYRTWAALLRLRRSHEAFSSPDTEVEIRAGQGIQDRRIRLTHPDLQAVIIGNFGLGPRAVAPTFQQTGRWYEFFSGDSLEIVDVNAPIVLPPGDFRIYTTHRFVPPEPGLITVDASPEALPPHSTALAAFESTFPNPFSENATISYVLGAPGDVTLEIFDVLGRRVAVLEQERKAAGSHRVEWRAAGMPAGTYVIRLRADSQHAATTLLLAR